MPKPTQSAPKANCNNALTFATPKALSRWLQKNHATESELWVKIFKKGSGRSSVDWNEVVVEALCWGWIDGIKKPLDDQAYLQRITPRKRGSKWSKRNREHVERLTKEGRMQEPGLVHVRAAKADGRWDNAYAPPSEMTVPEDFLATLESRPKAKEFFETLSKANQFAIAYRLATAKKPETRERRIGKLLRMLENGEKLH